MEEKNKENSIENKDFKDGNIENNGEMVRRRRISFKSKGRKVSFLAKPAGRRRRKPTRRPSFSIRW
ncbi:MAG: hypothetical protein PHG85_04900 [Candidatus Altiarchaeota archaeon]|nr:hypothetical protein [Candidatus Altiarchaeota archaeon]